MKTNIRKTILTGIMTCLSVIVAWADIPIDEAHFPDAGFRTWLRGQIYGFDGVITDAEINNIFVVGVSNSDDCEVYNVKGIEYFTSMTSLSVPATVDAVDVSVCPQLESLCVSLWGNSEMTSIDLSHNPLLKEFICVGSAIRHLDLTNNPLLTDLFVNDCEQLETMDISNCKKLVDLRCDKTKLSSIDVSNCKDLYQFNCFDCPNLTSIKVTGCEKLCYFRCWDTPVASIDVSTWKALAEYLCDRTNMTKLDLTPNGGITVLTCTGGKLTEVILPNSLVLDIQCQDNPQLATLTIPGNAHLNTLNFSNTQVSTVDLTSSVLLYELLCNNTKISSLDVTHCPLISNLECTNTPLRTLDLSQGTDLDRVILNDNQLTELKMPASCKLVTLDCQNNKLATLDLTGCRQMQVLNCQNNRLTSLLMPAPIVYPDDYPDYRYELYEVNIADNQLKGAAVDAIIDKLPQKEYEGYEFKVYDSTTDYEGNIITTTQVAAAKAKNWTALYCYFIDPTNPDPLLRTTWGSYDGYDPSGIQQTRIDKEGIFYTLGGTRLQGQPARKGVYIRNNKKVLVR